MSSEIMEKPINPALTRTHPDAVLIIEARDLLFGFLRQANKLGFDGFISDNVPTNLDEFMTENDITFGVFHNLRLMDEKPIIDAVRSGKHIAIIESGIATDMHFEMYQRIEDAGGVRMYFKGFEVALEKLLKKQST